ncbi:type II toxin-antitoxin system RelB/DinJ family antitoxin [Maridesulfovibrio ferrireducens]|uniref:type II toxin-antitoxin system RelB/DinJ family antitoxin n=1 Tax=Maridesulfovibrio ferrireducens TaxID=246191 RepID=UPI001A1C5C6D|nr:type II toxin-antitoxin system RelB/DinJ family antitoxin [Maridesulfovibrio ferrireducens]MBI9109976.1 type II toxin-antitoxin system RelB/DinJ family antitoxin [Maridesulfovibrio ferrireducens]
MENTTLNIRVPKELKAGSKEALQMLGLTPSAAIRLFLTHVVNQQAIPFTITTEKYSERSVSNNNITESSDE